MAAYQSAEEGRTLAFPPPGLETFRAGGRARAPGACINCGRNPMKTLTMLAAVLAFGEATGSRCAARAEWRALSGDRPANSGAAGRARSFPPAGAWRATRSPRTAMSMTSSAARPSGTSRSSWSGRLTPGGNSRILLPRNARVRPHLLERAGIPAARRCAASRRPQPPHLRSRGYALYAAPAGVVKAAGRMEHGTHRRRRRPRRALAERAESRGLRVVERGLEGESRGQQVCALAELRAREVRATSASRATTPGT